MRRYPPTWMIRGVLAWPKNMQGTNQGGTPLPGTCIGGYANVWAAARENSAADRSLVETCSYHLKAFERMVD